MRRQKLLCQFLVKFLIVVMKSSMLSQLVVLLKCRRLNLLCIFNVQGRISTKVVLVSIPYT